MINPQIVEGETVFQIETKSDWQPNTPADFKVELDEYAEFDAEYLALSIAVKNLASDWFVFRFGVNDSYFCYGEVSNANQYTAVTSAGNSFSVLQQYGYWFFVPNGFDGVIYIPVSQCYVDGSLVSQAKNIYIQYDDSLASQSTVAFRSVYCVDQIGLEGTQKYPVFDFINLSADIEGNVSNDTDGRYTGRNLQASIVRDKYRSCDGVELHNDFINSLNITVKTASAGGTVVAQPYEFGWVAVDLGENAFTLADGIALNIF